MQSVESEEAPQLALGHPAMSRQGQGSSSSGFVVLFAALCPCGVETRRDQAEMLKGRKKGEVRKRGEKHLPAGLSPLINQQYFCPVSSRML